MQAPLNNRGEIVRERICLFAGPGAGKTRAVLSIAKWHQLRKSPAKFWVLSSDLAYEQMTGPGTPFSTLTNLEVFDVEGWEDWRDGAKKAYENAGPHDWLVPDLYDGAWADVADYYIEAGEQKMTEDYWLEKAKEGAEGWDLFEDLNYTVINKWYRQLSQRYVLRFPGHVIACCSDKELQQASRRQGGGLAEKSDIAQWFGRIGSKPAGQKDIPRQFRSVIKMSEPAKKGGGYTMTSAKDRERELMEGVEVGDFARDYLVGVAGWTL